MTDVFQEKNKSKKKMQQKVEEVKKYIQKINVNENVKKVKFSES